MVGDMYVYLVRYMLIYGLVESVDGGTVGDCLCAVDAGDDKTYRARPVHCAHSTLTHIQYIPDRLLRGNFKVTCVRKVTRSAV